MTEDEAKTKWCPFVRVGMYGGNSTTGNNRGIATATPDTVTCIGSRCMAWRDVLNMDDSIRVIMKGGEMVEDPTKPRNGFYGLAGKP